VQLEREHALCRIRSRPGHTGSFAGLLRARRGLGIERLGQRPAQALVHDLARLAAAQRPEELL